MESSLHPDWSDGGKYEKQTNKKVSILIIHYFQICKDLVFHIEVVR